MFLLSKFNNLEGNPKRVLLVTNMYPSKAEPYKGVFVKNAADSLKENGFSLDIVKIEPSKSKLFEYFKLYIKVFKFLFQGDYTHIYIHFPSHTFLAVFLGVLIKPRIKLITHVHGSDAKKNDCGNLSYLIKRAMCKACFKYSYKVLCPSPSYRNFIKSSYGLSEEKLSVYPSGGVNSEVFYPKELHKNKHLKILYAGRLEKGKRVDKLLLLCDWLTKNNMDYECEIIGNGREKHELMSSTEHLENISFYDFLSPKDLGAKMRDADLFVYPSISESLGLAPIESMSCGTPILVSNIDVFKEYVKEGLNGFTFNDFDEMTRKMNSFYWMNYEERLLMSKNCISSSKKYSSEAVQEVLINVFK